MGVAASFVSASLTPAHAVPSFAAQTGMPCKMCHIGALGPQLTPYGRNFKIKGYTIAGGEGLASQYHFALWTQEGYQNVQKPNPQATTPHFADNNNVFFQAVSLFYSGRFTDHIGAFLQATYDNTAKVFAQDNSDIRVVGDTTVSGHDVDYGVSFNNAPGWTDPYNSNYLWGFPYISSFLQPGPNAGTILAGTEQDNSWGIVPYAWIDQHIFIDAGLYKSQSPWYLKTFGETYGAGSTTGVEPYVGGEYAWFWGQQNAHVGVTFFEGRYNPGLNAKGRGASGAFGHDKYDDVLVHGGYQYISDEDTPVNVFTAEALFDYEHQHLEGSSPGQPDNHLLEFSPWATYYYKETFGFNVKFDKIWGNHNPFLYNTGATDSTGSWKGSPNSTYWVLEADWVPFGKEDSFWRPFINAKIGLQYTIYTQFNGSSTNYDGLGHNASDNNTLFLFIWDVF
jgi:hypothetical protein